MITDADLPPDSVVCNCSGCGLVLVPDAGDGSVSGNRCWPDRYYGTADTPPAVFKRSRAGRPLCMWCSVHLPGERGHPAPRRPAPGEDALPGAAVAVRAMEDAG